MSHFAQRVEHFYDHFWQLIQPYNDTVSEIAKKADMEPDLRGVCSVVVGEVRSNLDYKSDRHLWGEEDYWASADEVSQVRAGDCDCLALFGSSILTAMGIDHYVVIGHFKSDIEGLEATPERAPGHVWLEVDEGPYTYLMEFTTPRVYTILRGDYSKVPYHPVEHVLIR